MDIERFDAFMARALYGPDGFFTVAVRAGRDGAFLTSPEVGPLFGVLVGRALDARWRAMGEPADFHVVDAGAGRGMLARTVTRSSPACAGALRWTLVEVSPAGRAEHPSWAASAVELPMQADVIVANELLDNLPFRLLESVGGEWRDIAVGADGSTALCGPGRTEAVPYAPQSDGARVPLQEAAAAWVADALARLRPGGLLLAIDYCATTAELATRPFTEWIRTYAAHGRAGSPFEAPGTKDITVDVCIDQLPPPTRTATQADWLRGLGLDDLVAEGRAHWAEHRAAPDVAALAMASRVGEAEALTAVPGLGAHTVLEWDA